MHRTAIGVLAGLSLFSAAYAQDDAVVITAPRFPEDVRRLPANVTVIEREDIARSAARTIPELLTGAVGLTMKDFYGNNAAGTSVDLRGFGITGPQNTLILLDGRRLNDFDLSGVQWSAIPLTGVERIEIVRGTGSVLYGDNASAGIINIVTRSPLQEGSSVEVFGRTASYKTVEGQLYGSQGTSQFGVNGSVYGYRSDGYRQNNRNEQLNGTLNTRWALDQGSVDLRFGREYQNLRLPGGRFVQPSIGLDEYASDPRGTNTPLDWATRDGTRAGATLLQRFGSAEFLLGLDYRDKRQQSFFDQNGFPTFRDDDLDLTSITPRVRVPFGTGDLRHSMIVGLDWNSWNYHSRRGDRPENNGRPANTVTVTQDTTAFYLQDTIDLTRTTLATLGWRSEQAKYNGKDVADPTSPSCFFCSAAAPVSETQRQNAWELGLRQALTREVHAFARANRSYRFVNAEEIYENNRFFAPEFQILRPQQAKTYEGGFGWKSGGNALRTALFRTDVSDEIHLDPFTNGIGNTNLAPSRRQGVEIDGGWQPVTTLRVSGGYAYTDAKFREGSFAGAPVSIGTDISGKTVPLVPRHKFNLAGSWDVMPKTRFSAAFTAVSSQVLDNDEPNSLDHRIPAYRVLDLKLAQTAGQARIAFTINNVFNQSYYTYAVRSNFTPDRYAVYPLPGRTFGLSAELKI